MDFTTKHTLKFREDGTFRVLMMSDLQESPKYDIRSLNSVEALLDEAKPDVVIWGGDNCYGPEINCEKDLHDFLEIFTKPFEERKIPWAHVFGNHDHDAPIEMCRQQEMYEKYPMCISKHTDESVHGKTNFVLPVYNSKNEIALALWGLDTNRHIDDLDYLTGGNLNQKANLPNMPIGGGIWGMIYFDQLMWYWNTSTQLENQAGKKVPGLMCMHIAPYEYKTAVANPEICVKNGYYGEELGSMPFNTGLFSTILQRGDVKSLCCGHTHHNNFEAEYCGIKLHWDACVGYRCYGTDAHRGGRLFIYSEDSPENFETKMINTLPLI